MAAYIQPRLHRDHRALAFWCGACVIAFVLAFALGAVWSSKRGEQDQWARYEAVAD